MRKKFTSSSLFILVFILSMGIESSKVIAQDMVRVTAVARVVYESFSADTQKKAINLAKKTALKKYFRKLPTAKKRQLKAFEGEFYKNMDDFITEVKIQQEKNDEEKNTFAVAIVASIDPGAIDAFFADNSAAGNQNVGESSDFGAMFIARTESERKSFDAKRTSVVETDSSQSQVAEDASSDSRSVTSSREKTFDLKKSGGSTSRKRDKVSYEFNLDLSEDIAASVGEHLVNAGFEPMAMDELDGVPYLDEIGPKLRRGRLPGRILKGFKRAAVDAGWTFLGYGLIDLGMPKSDAARGIVKVPAKVSFTVWMLTDGRAKSVAVVRPKVVYGSDSSGDAGAAETDAYNRAVALAMDTVVSQLQQKGLR